MTAGPSAPTGLRLSKSRFVAGWRCPLFLWYRVHEPDAPELVPTPSEQDRMDQGHAVGILAQREFPGGVGVELDHTELGAAVAATREALASGPPAIYEASFFEDRVFVAVDILAREGDAFHLVEVKASTKTKDEHLPDVAVQLHVLREAGLPVERVSLMHLNPDYRHPGPEEAAADAPPLFTLTDMTGDAEAFLPDVPEMIREQLRVLEGPGPEAVLGARCKHGDRDCPFIDRCWPSDPDHVRRLPNVGPLKAAKWMAEGMHNFDDADAAGVLSPVMRRHVEAYRRGGLVVEPGLADALAPLAIGTIGFLDFETVSRAVPVWPGTRPWDQVPVQFSYHERRPDGTTTHAEWIAGPAERGSGEPAPDPRPELARALIEATAGARHILTYTNYEDRCLKHLERAVRANPGGAEGEALAEGLAGIRARLFDLKPVVKNHLAHPDFKGSYSIKAVLAPLTGNQGYGDLEVQAGDTASVLLARLILDPESMSEEEAEKLRRDLLAYCQQDTRAMVELLEALERIAAEEEDR